MLTCQAYAKFTKILLKQGMLGLAVFTSSGRSSHSSSSFMVSPLPTNVRSSPRWINTWGYWPTSPESLNMALLRSLFSGCVCVCEREACKWVGPSWDRDTYKWYWNNVGRGHHSFGHGHAYCIRTNAPSNSSTAIFLPAKTVSRFLWATSARGLDVMLVTNTITFPSDIFSAWNLLLVCQKRQCQ